MNFFRSLGKKTSDGLVNVGSGKTKLGSFDTPRAYNAILGFGIVALLVSGWIVWGSVFGATSLRPTNTTNTTTNTTKLSVAETTKLQQQDTDGDTLSDYDELYVYHTSPYLKDTDGDGIGDLGELQQGTDPSCPSGKVCEGFQLLTSVTDANGQLTPAFLRQALAQAGVSQTALDKTDDATLLSLYNQITNTSSTNTNTVTNTTTNTSSTDALTTLDNLTPDQIRQLLQDNGIDQATLSQVDDSTLQSIFRQSVSSVTNTSQ